jgi:hypothetical protein
VNHGALYPKYRGGEGVFYYCPANPQWGYYDTTYGWPTFKYDTAPPGPALNWGGFHYAVPVVPGCYPKDDGRLSFRIPAALFPKGIPPSKSPSAPVPDGYGGLYDSRYVQYPAESGYQGTQGYIQVALRQKSAFSPPYMGKSMAVLTDALFGAKAHRALGFNVLFTDFHAKWVPGSIPLKMNNETRPLAKWDGTSGTVASPPPRMGMWNVLSSKP